MIRIILAISFLTFFTSSSFAQSDPLNNQRKQQIATDSLPRILDSLTIIPESLVVKDKNSRIIPPKDYLLLKNELFWIGAEKPDSLYLEYKVLPYDLYKSFSHLDTSRIEIDGKGDYIGFDFSPYEPQEGLIDFKGLDYNGSFARGVSFGNNQNLVLNSSFNLRLAGNLGDDVEILAAIRDDNIPLQPEGNTQQLQEFDQIFIQLKKGNSSLTAGDYELGRPNSYFMNYFKKLKGATVNNVYEIDEKSSIRTKASVAIARGKFSRNSILAQEGNQGPYRLIGADGEQFIIVLGGTEKVFLDGELLKRGLEEDYIIDYNRADILFTNKRLMTKDSRIIIEFEYVVLNYTRSLYAFSTEYQSEKWRLYLNVYSEQDATNSGAANDLDSLQRAILRSAGDSPENAIAPGIDTLEEFNQFRVSYKSIDTTYFVNGIPRNESILIFSTDKDSALFSANFVEVPFGQGNYVIDNTTAANGRVYRWVAPDASTGRLQGNYILGRKLIAPNKRALYTIGGEYKISKNSSILTEIGISDNDLNRFSELDNDDNTGMSIYSQFNNSRTLDKKKQWTLDTQLGYEFVQESFQALNPYRNAEFTRDWNINTLTAQKAQEHIGKGGFTISKKNLGSINYEFSGFLRDSIYTGTKHFIKAIVKKNGFSVDLQSNQVNTDALEGRSIFSRPKFDISKTFENWDNWKIGVYGEREKNDQYDADSDTLSKLSFYYDLYKVYIESKQSETFGIGINYRQRFDYAPVRKEFIQNTVADEFNINGNWRQSKASNLRWNLSYRKLSISDSTLTNVLPQETYLGRLEHTLTLFKGAIRSSTNYEIGSGQERKQEFQYLPVAPGEGVFTWIADLNGDSIPQLNEIEEAVFQNQADIIRVSIFTDEFIRTNNVSLNQSLRIDPRTLWYREKGTKKFLSRFSTQSTLRIIRKTKEADNISAWNPFQLSIADTSLVSVASSIRNTLFFNQGDSKYDLQLGMFDNRNKVVLTSGFESRRNQEQFFRTRWNITKKLSNIVSLARGNRQNDSEFFDNRDFDIEYFRIEPQLTFLPFKNFRNILTYQYRNSQNILPEGGETAIIHDFSLEATFNQSNKTSFRTNFSYVRIDYNGIPDSSLEFAMLEGLRNGENFLWDLTFDRRLAKNIQLVLNYEGRKSGDANIVHVGRAQVRATF